LLFEIERHLAGVEELLVCARAEGFCRWNGRIKRRWETIREAVLAAESSLA
jgi:hypothetical protein